MFDATKTKAVLWDLDDTLYSRVEAARKTFFGMLREHLYPNREKEFYRDAVNLMMENISPNSMIHQGVFQALLDAYPPDKAFDREACVNHYYQHICEYVEPFPEQIQVVQKLRSLGIKTAIVTNIQEKRLDSQRRKVEALGVAELFDVIVYSGELGIHKPDRRIFDYTAELLGVSNAECVFVGDAPESDVIGGLNAGMEVVWIDRWKEGNRFAKEPSVHRVESVLEYFSPKSFI